MYEPDELVAFTTKPQENPYRAQFPRRLPDRYGGGDMVWPVAVVCGHNPYVTAKLVENVRAVPGENGTGTLQWERRVEQRQSRSAERERLTGRQESVSLPHLRSDATWENVA
jgi:hypothetical protein